MVVGILTEKNSAARNFATALGGTSSAMTGEYSGELYAITAARGHLYELKTLKIWSLSLSVRNTGIGISHPYHGP